MPRAGSNSLSGSASDEASAQPDFSARQKKKFCMYHLQGVCRFADSGCSFAHSTEEMHGGRAHKVRQGQGHGASNDRIPGNVRRRVKKSAEADGFARRPPTQMQPAHLAEAHRAPTAAQGLPLEQGTVPSEFPFPWGHGTSKVSRRSKANLDLPPGLAWMQYQESMGHTLPRVAIPPPRFPGPMGHVLPIPVAQGYPIQSARNTAGLMKGNGAGAAAMAEWAHAGDERVAAARTSEIDQRQLANIVNEYLQRALLTTSPNLDVDVIGSLLRGPPGLSPSFPCAALLTAP